MVLVSDFVQIDRPFDAVSDELVAAGPGWLGESLVAAYAEGEQLSVRVASSLGPIRVSKRVWAELGEMSVKPDRVTQPLRWRAAGATGLFPAMVADLEFAPMGTAMTAISFMGRYVPPLGPLGREVDRDAPPPPGPGQRAGAARHGRRQARGGRREAAAADRQGVAGGRVSAG